jgi:hypothetical protein
MTRQAASPHDVLVVVAGLFAAICILAAYAVL